MSGLGAAGLIELDQGAFLSKCWELLGTEIYLKICFDVSFESCRVHGFKSRCVSMPILGAAGSIQLFQGAFRCQFGELPGS